MDLEFPNLYRFSWQADRQFQYVLALHFWYSGPNSPPRVVTTFSNQTAAVPSEMPDECSPFHIWIAIS